MSTSSEVKSHFVVYVVEGRGPRERVFGPIYNGNGQYEAYITKRRATQKIKELSAAYPANEYRATGYWDARPW